MAEISKPSFAQLWANGGAIIAPSNTKVELGWTAEIPPHQWENYVQNRQDRAIAYLFQRGIAEWDSSTEYFANKSVVMYNGNVYKAILNSTAQAPSNTTYWSNLINNSSETAPGIIEIATAAEVQAGTDNTRAVSPAGLSSRTATETRTGLIELATSAEVQAGSDTTRAVTPAGLSARTATESRTGVVELATQAEVNAGTDNTRAVTPLGLANRPVTIPNGSITVNLSGDATGSGTISGGIININTTVSGGGGGGSGGSGETEFGNSTQIWGSGTTDTDAGASAGDLTITFPTPFVNASAYSGTFTPQVVYNGSVENTVYQLFVKNRSAGSMTLHLRAITGASLPAGGVRIDYIIVGQTS